MVRSKCFSTGGKAIYRNQVDEIVIGSINGVFLFRILITLTTNTTNSLIDYTWVTFIHCTSIRRSRKRSL